MNKAFSFLVILLVLSACGRRTNFTISGQLDGGSGKKIYLEKILMSSQLRSDSVKLDKEGKFKFKGTTSAPAFYLLKLSKNSFTTLLVDSSENVVIKGSYKNFTRDCKVSGSIGSEALLDLNNRFYKAKSKLDSLQKLYNAHKNDPIYSSKIKEWDNNYISVLSDHSNYVISYIKQNPFSLSTVYALYQKWDNNNYVVNDLPTMKTAASALFAVYPKNEQVISLYNNTLQFIKEENNKRLIDALNANAVNTPNITLPDTDGHERSLWSLHGKYVLLHFWSAKDRASRVVNPVLSEVYNKYKNRGFEIYMVSLDNDRAAWMEAIAEDNLSCINVGDMKGSIKAVNSYNIQEIPSNYLIDKEGKIIGKNLKGPALNNALNDILK
jgi:peroxiredoxin